MGAKAFFTIEDTKIAFNLFCAIYGIGTLGMPTNFSRAGPVIATIALLLTAVINIYASVVCSRTMLLAPRSVKTLGDLGEWSMGKFGRYSVVISQMGVCLLGPCAFLVLGGTLLNNLFPDAFSTTTWIVLMAIQVLPVCLIPTLKEGAGVAFAGSLGTLLADVIGVGVLLHGMSGHPSVPTPNLSFKQVSTSFGNLTLAYSAGIVIPALQRQHSDPKRMPRVIFVTMVIISVLFLVLASTGYSAVGCQISGNMLFSIYPDATTGINTLGFSPDKGMVILAYLGMQVHITIAFNVIICPVFYILERIVLGMHKQKQQSFEDNYQGSGDSTKYDEIQTPTEGAVTITYRDSKNQSVTAADLEKQSNPQLAAYEEEVREYTGSNVIKYIVLRISIVICLTVLSIIFKDHFLDLTDFYGSSAITLCCIILPIMFYLKKFWPKVPLYEKAGAILAILVCVFLGCYVTYLSGKNLFNPDPTSDDDPTFPFCHEEYQSNIYYQKNNSTNST